MRKDLNQTVFAYLSDEDAGRCIKLGISTFQDFALSDPDDILQGGLRVSTFRVLKELIAGRRRHVAMPSPRSCLSDYASKALRARGYISLRKIVEEDSKIFHSRVRSWEIRNQVNDMIQLYRICFRPSLHFSRHVAAKTIEQAGLAGSSIEEVAMTLSVSSEAAKRRLSLFQRMKKEERELVEIDLPRWQKQIDAAAQFIDIEL